MEDTSFKLSQSVWGHFVMLIEASMHLITFITYLDETRWQHSKTDRCEKFFPRYSPVKMFLSSRQAGYSNR